MGVIPARIESGELVERNKFERQFKDKFDYLLPIEWISDKRSFWDLKIPYVPLYAFEELVAVREKRLNEGRIAQELVEAYEKIWEAMVVKASPPGREPWRWRPQTGKVLIVEDIPAWQKLLKEIVITKAGEEYELATNRDSAINMLKDHDYKLTILNLNLSSSSLAGIIGYEGIDVLDFLKATGRKMPVLIIASEAINPFNIKRQYPENVRDFFFKGSRGESLAQNLTESIRKHLDNQ